MTRTRTNSNESGLSPRSSPYFMHLVIQTRTSQTTCIVPHPPVHRYPTLETSINTGQALLDNCSLVMTLIRHVSRLIWEYLHTRGPAFPYLTSPVDDVSAEVSTTPEHQQGNLIVTRHTRHSPPSAASHSAQPILGCLTLGTAHSWLPHIRHGPSSAASHSAQHILGCLTLGTAHSRLPHTRHSPLSAASHSAQPTLDCLYLATARFSFTPLSSRATFKPLLDAVTYVHVDASGEHSVRFSGLSRQLPVSFVSSLEGEYCSGLGFQSWDPVFPSLPTRSHSSLSPCGALTLLSIHAHRYSLTINLF